MKEIADTVIADSDRNTERLKKWNKHLELLMGPDYCHVW